jgi:hypothetical protein
MVIIEVICLQPLGFGLVEFSELVISAHLNFGLVVILLFTSNLFDLLNRKDIALPGYRIMELTFARAGQICDYYFCINL